MITKGIFSLLILTALIGCKKCVDCNTTYLSNSERKIMLTSYDQLFYTDGLDTFPCSISKDLDEAENEICGRFPFGMTCRSDAYLNVYLNDSTANYRKLFNANIYKEQKRLKYETKYDIKVGPFELGVRADTLCPAKGKSYTFKRLNNYSFNSKTYQNVLEITNGAERVLYHPDLGYIEITFEYPEVTTYRLIP